MVRHEKYQLPHLQSQLTYLVQAQDNTSQDPFNHSFRSSYFGNLYEQRFRNDLVGQDQNNFLFAFQRMQQTNNMSLFFVEPIYYPHDNSSYLSNIMLGGEIDTDQVQGQRQMNQFISQLQKDVYNIKILEQLQKYIGESKQLKQRQKDVLKHGHYYLVKEPYSLKQPSDMAADLFYEMKCLKKMKDDDTI